MHCWPSGFLSCEPATLMFGINRNEPRVDGRHKGQKRRKTEGRQGRQESLRNAVLALVNDLKWSGKDGISTLHRLLVASGRSDVRAKIRLLVWSTSCTAKRAKQGFCASPAHAVSNPIITSALERKTDSSRTSRYVRFVPRSDISSSSDQVPP